MPAECPACSRVTFQSAVCLAFPFNVLDCMLEATRIFEVANFVLWNALKLRLGPNPLYLVNELCGVSVCEALG